MFHCQTGARLLSYWVWVITSQVITTDRWSDNLKNVKTWRVSRKRVRLSSDQDSFLTAPKKLWEMAARLSGLTNKWWWMRAGANTELTTYSRSFFHDTHEAPHNYARSISICTTWHGTIRMNLGLIGVARSASVKPGVSAQGCAQTQLCSRQGRAWDTD